MPGRIEDVVDGRLIGAVSPTEAEVPGRVGAADAAAELAVLCGRS